MIIMGDFRETRTHYSSTIDFRKINVEPLGHGYMNVHLGFLNKHQRYHVEFHIPWNGCWHLEDDSLPPAISFGEQSPYCRIMEFVGEKDHLLRLKVEVYVNAESIFKEQLLIACCNSGAPLTLFMRAKIAAENDGPTILRKGIHLIEDFSNEDVDSPE